MLEIKLNTHDLEVIRKAFKCEELHSKKMIELERQNRFIEIIPKIQPRYCEGCGLLIDSKKPSSFDVIRNSHGRISLICLSCKKKIEK